MMISDILAPLGIPVCHPPYSGGERRFATYQYMGQSGVTYAEGREACTGSMMAVDLYTDGSIADSAALLVEIKRLLAEAGYLATVDAEMYERDTGLRHYALTAATAEEQYG